MTVPRPTLILFAKAPRFGSVKTRLARRVGPVESLRFHRARLGHMTRTLGRDRRWRTVLAVSPDGARGPWTGGLPLLDQGRGDLGARMRRCLEAAPGRGPVVLVGSDIPDLRSFHVARAFAVLRRRDVVFGPAEDGGFWLVGVSRRRPVPRFFAGVRWSTAHALADCLDRLPDHRVALVDRLADLDA